MTTFIFDGHHGEEVISSQQSADINTGIYGDGCYVLPVGSEFEAATVSNNEVTIQDGICSIQGHRGGLDYGQNQSFTIENGASGLRRRDLLIIRYTKDESTLVESFSFHTIKGTAAASDPEDPDITEADIRDGALVTEAALYRVHIDGLSIVAVERIWEYPESMPVSEEGAWSLAPLIAPFELTLPAGFDEDSFFRYGILDGEKRYFASLNPTSTTGADTTLGTLDSAYRPAEAVTLQTNLAGVTVTISTAGVVKLVASSAALSVPAGLLCRTNII